MLGYNITVQDFECLIIMVHKLLQAQRNVNVHCERITFVLLTMCPQK